MRVRGLACAGQASATCLAHLRSTDEMDDGAGVDENAEPEAAANHTAADAASGPAAPAVKALKSAMKVPKATALPPAAAAAQNEAEEPPAPRQEAFEALPESVRGRVKFETIDRVFRVASGLFIAQNCKLMKGATPDAVPLRDLHELGCTVHGRSGEQTINSLRALGLLLVSKEGIKLSRPITKAERAEARAGGSLASLRRAGSKYGGL